jgi:uncharacterized protein YdaU (DUF1376 family)
MTAEERGVYCQIIFNLYESGGYLPMDKATLAGFCNCTNFENVFEKIKHKFLIKNEKISQKRVLAELKRARQISQLQRQNGLKGMESRWGGDNKAITKLSHSNNKAITKRSEDKRSEEKKGEAHCASPSGSSNGSSLRHASAPAAVLRQQDAGGTIPRDLTMRVINFHDDLCRIFPQRTPSDSSSIRNLANWVGGRIRLGEFQDKIIGNVLVIARDSKKGKSRKPIAVFYARLKKELNYESDR